MPTFEVKMRFITDRTFAVPAETEDEAVELCQEAFGEFEETDLSESGPLITSVCRPVNSCCLLPPEDCHCKVAQ